MTSTPASRSALATTFRAPVVPVQAQLGDDHPDAHHCLLLTGTADRHG